MAFDGSGFPSPGSKKGRRRKKGSAPVARANILRCATIQRRSNITIALYTALQSAVPWCRSTSQNSFFFSFYFARSVFLLPLLFLTKRGKIRQTQGTESSSECVCLCTYTRYSLHFIYCADWFPFFLVEKHRRFPLHRL